MRPPDLPNRTSDLRSLQVSVDRLVLRGPHRWIYVGAYPADPLTTPDSPPFQNSWANELGNYDPLAFRWDEHWRLEFQGEITGGATNTVAFTLPATHIPDKHKPFPIIVIDGATKLLSVAEIDHTTGDVTITLP
jgi:hypothetical protein